jgi:undecaprenyl-diphosphatase UppP
MGTARIDSPAVTILQAIILGIVQGVTEFAPISSSGHLILVPWAFGWEIVQDPALNKTFDVALHMGTLLGAIVYFRTDLWRYLRAFIDSCRARAIRTTDERLAWAIVVGTIPGMIVGAAFESVIEDTLGQPVIIAVMLAVFGVVLYVVDRVARSDRGIETIGPRTGLFTGIAQALALQPGVSRSGITITAGRLIGLDRETAAPDHRGGRRPEGDRRGTDRVPRLRGAVPGRVHRRGRQRVPRDLVPAAVPADPRFPALHGLPPGGRRHRDRAGRDRRSRRHDLILVRMS